MSHKLSPSDLCANVQVDLYYAPEIKNIGPNGSGTQNIASEIYQKDPSCDVITPGGGNGGGGSTTPGTPVTPGKGSIEPPTPVAPVAPAATVPSVAVNSAPVVTELPHTGPSDATNLLPIGILVAAVVYVMSYLFLPRHNDENAF